MGHKAVLHGAQFDNCCLWVVSTSASQENDSTMHLIESAEQHINRKTLLQRQGVVIDMYKHLFDNLFNDIHVLMDISNVPP